jgi:hypothetical protein
LRILRDLAVQVDVELLAGLADPEHHLLVTQAAQLAAAGQPLQFGGAQSSASSAASMAAASRL